MQPGILFIALIAALQIQYGARPIHASISGYLDFDNLPETNFSCEGKVIGGYYADVETGCQMFHVCTIGQKQLVTDIKFLCLNGTVFDQETRVCERVDEVDCSQAEEYYGLNLELYGANAFIAGVSDSTIQEDLDDAANSEEAETSTLPNTTPSTTSTTTVAATTPTTTTTTTTTTLPPPPPRSPSPSPSVPPKFIPPTPRPSPHSHHQYGPTSPGTLSLLAFAQNQNHEGLADVVPHQHQQIFHNSQRPILHPSQPTRQSLFPTTRRPPLSLSLKPQLVSTRPPIKPQQPQQHVIYQSTTRPPQIVQPQHQQHPLIPSLQGFKPFRPDQKSQQELQREKEQQQQQQQQQQHDPFSTQHHYFGSGFQHKHNFQHHTQLPQSSPSSIILPSPSPTPSHLLSPPPPPPSQSPSQAPYHHTQQFHPILLNGLALEQVHNQQPSPSPSPTPTSYFNGHHFSTSVPNIREGKSLDETAALEAAHEAHQQEIQKQQQEQQQKTFEEQQHHHQQHQEKLQKQQQRQIQQQQQQIKQQQKEHQQHIHHHFPPPPTVAVVSSSSSTSTSHSSVAIVTGGFNSGVTSTTTTPTPPPVTSTSISISGPSAEGHTIIDHRLPVDSSAPSAEGATEIYDDEYTDPDYSLDSFFDDVPKLRSDERRNRRRRRKRESDDPSGSTSVQEGIEARKRGRGRSKFSSVPLQVSTSFVAVDPEARQPVRTANVPENSGQFHRRGSHTDGTRSFDQQPRPHQKSRISQVRSSFNAHPINEEEPVLGIRSRTNESRRRSNSRGRASSVKVPSTREEENATIPVESTTMPELTTIIPETNFTCEGKSPGGLYADTETDCVVFHICSQGRHSRLTDNKFLCGPETRFNQQSRTCQAKEMVDCASSTKYYFLNTHFQHQVLVDMQVHPELQFEPLKVRKRRNAVPLYAEKSPNTLSPQRPQQEIIPNAQHCFDEEQCRNKWKARTNLEISPLERERRDLANPLFDRKRPRFGINARRTTTQKPKESKPATIRFPNRNFMKPTPAPSRKIESSTKAVQGKTTVAPRSFVPSHNKFKRPITTTEPTTTESSRRKSFFTRPTIKPKFNRNSPLEPNREDKHTTTESTLKRNNKLPTTFRRHQILAQSKVPKPVEETKIEEKQTTTTIAPKDLSKEIKEKINDNKKLEKEDVNYDDEEYADEESEESDVNTVEGREIKVTTDSPLQSGNVRNSLAERPSNVKSLKTEGSIMLTPRVDSLKDTPGVKVINLPEKEDLESNDKKNKAIFDDDEEIDSSDEYYDDDDEEEENVEDETGSENIKDTGFTRNHEISNPLTIGSSVLDNNSKRKLYIDNDPVNTGMDATEEGYDEENYDDEDLESEEVDDIDTDNNQESYISGDTVILNNNERVRVIGRKFSSGRSNIDVTELSPTRTTLVGKQDAEFGLNAGDEDDFEETNRAVRKTSAGRRRNQALGSGEKALDGNGKVIYGKSDREKSQAESPIRAYDVKGESDSDMTDYEDFEENEEVDEGEPIELDTQTGLVKSSNGQISLQRGRGNNRFQPQKVSIASKGALRDRKPPENQDGLLNEEDDDYADEYEENPNIKILSTNPKLKFGNNAILLNQGSLLHLPIPILKNTHFQIQNQDAMKRSDVSWEDDESYPFEDEDDEYTLEDNERFLDEEEEYDDQEEGHDHESEMAKGAEDDDAYVDEEEDSSNARDGKISRTKLKLPLNSEDEDYYDDEEESDLVDESKEDKSKDDEYDTADEFDKTTSGINETKQRITPPSNQKKIKGSSAPLPYLRLVNPDFDELTTLPPPPPNLFRTVKPRQKSWKQASAPEPPPVILHRSKVFILEPEVVQTTQSPSRYRGRGNGRLDNKKESNRVESLKSVTQKPDTLSSRQWQPRQRTYKEPSQTERISTTKGYKPSRGRFSVNENREDRPSRGRFSVNENREENQTIRGRTGKYVAPRRPSLRLPASTPSSTIKTTTERAFPSTKSIRPNRPRLRSHTRRKFSDEVQFSESQLSKSTHNLPFQEEDEFDVKYWPNNNGQDRVNSGKNRNFKELISDDRTESVIQPTMPTTVDYFSSTIPNNRVSSNSFFPLPLSTSAPPILEDKFSCSGKDMYIYHADPVNPRLFHYCSPGFNRGQLLDFRFSCVKGMTFSKVKQMCVKV